MRIHMPRAIAVFPFSTTNAIMYPTDYVIGSPVQILIFEWQYFCLICPKNNVLLQYLNYCLRNGLGGNHILFLLTSFYFYIYCYHTWDSLEVKHLSSKYIMWDVSNSFLFCRFHLLFLLICWDLTFFRAHTPPPPRARAGRKSF